MKVVRIRAIIVTIFATLIFSSCKKDEIATSPGNTINKAPLAEAGVDQTIMLPTNMVTIDGSNSSDPDGSIVSYAWSQITAPNQSDIGSPTKASSVVNNLIAGIYRFELKVTDNGGLSAKDTVQITVSTPVDHVFVLVLYISK